MTSYLSVFEQLEIQLGEIRRATNNFHDSKVIGVGGFGKVYEGELSYPDGKRMVAFKRLDRKHGQGDPEFFKEIRMLSCYKHDNLISLLGYCKEGDEMILIYEHASQGSLDRILNDANLTWRQRLKICLGAAKGLSFLHDPKGTQQRVLHRDIKSANILLDESLNAKVADFGLSKISPANQEYTLLVTNPVGTLGYCDPVYMDTYQLTKESDVYSFGVVLFEVFCGRVCYENSNGKLKVLVHVWKKSYEQKKLDEIIFPDIKHQLDPRSAETFVDIAYQCLQKSRNQRPTMSVVVEKLKAALEFKERYDLKLQREYEAEQMRKAAEYEAEQMRMAAEYEAEQLRKATEYEYGPILKLADPPLIYKSVKELKALVSKGLPINGGKTLLSINDKGEVLCERIYIEACLDQIQYDSLLFGLRNSRFPGGRCYNKHENELKVRVRAQFLCPQITYNVNLVFRNNMHKPKSCKTIHYKFDGKTKCCMVYNTYKREDGWFVVPLYEFTSDHETADFEIYFKRFPYGSNLQVAGFEFRPLEKRVELQNQGLEEYQDIVKAASQSLFYKTLEELKGLLSMGFHINNHKTWFSINENGEHCEMLSIAHCLISREGGYRFCCTELYSRFRCFYKTAKQGFKVHIRTQLLTPSIRYTVNLVLRKVHSSKKQMYVALRYKLEGETETSIVYLATTTKDNRSFIAELYQFTSDGRVFDLEIVFLDHKKDLQVEGILFQPFEKVEHEQLLEDEELSNDSVEWIIGSSFFNWFMGTDQEGYAVGNNGKKSLIFSARGAVRSDNLRFKSSSESRFGEVVVVTSNRFEIRKEVKYDVLLPETIYETYLIYKVPQNQSNFECLLKMIYFKGDSSEYWLLSEKEINSEFPYINLVSPPETPFIGQKLDQNNHNPLNRPKRNDVPRQRSDGWMEVKVSEFQTRNSTDYFWWIKKHILVGLQTPDYSDISGLIIESIELRPKKRPIVGQLSYDSERYYYYYSSDSESEF